MTTSLLARMHHTPLEIAHLPDAPRLAVLHFLLDWEAVDDALATLSQVGLDASEESHALAARALRRAGRATEALALSQQLLARVEPGSAEDALALRELALATLATGDHANAIALAETFNARTQKGSDGWLLLGDVQLASGNLANADLAFTQAQLRAASNPAAHIGRLRCALAADDAEATAAHLRALAPVSGGIEALRNDELQSVRAALQATGDIPAQGWTVNAVNQTLLQRFDREQTRIAALIAQTQMHARQHAAGGSEAAPATTLRGRELRQIQSAARKYFGHATLLPLQAEIIVATRRGADVLGVLATGGGKSLCYQLPAYLDEGINLVVSPLLALMKDQVDNLPARLRAQAVAIHSGMQSDDLKQALAGIGEGRYRLIFTSPERLRQRNFVDLLRRAGVVRFVIDEAHCVSVWGHDFRPDYLHLARVHVDLGAPPLLALTATAPPPVRADVLRILFANAERAGRAPAVIIGNRGRPNLWLGATQVADDEQREQRIATLCRTLPGSGVIYVRSRARADALAALLREQGVEAAAYHAGRSNREQVQEQFKAGALRVVVATIAFGMGVDKRDIRFVIHSGLPNSLESYLQETGRAGRDGAAAICMLYYTARDLDAQVEYAQRSNTDPELLQRLHAALLQGAGNGKVVSMRIDQAAQLLRSEETAIRVALSLLEEAGLVQRDYDTPQSVKIYLRKASKGVAFQRFLQASRLGIGAPVQWSWLELAGVTGIPAQQLEQRLLDWQNSGFLHYYGSGRDMLLHVRAPRTPREGAQAGPARSPATEARLQALIDRRARTRVQHAQEVVRFVRSMQCRQAFLADYAGSDGAGNQAAARCNHCDNCGVTLSQLLKAA